MKSVKASFSVGLIAVATVIGLATGGCNSPSRSSTLRSLAHEAAREVTQDAARQEIEAAYKAEDEANNRKDLAASYASYSPDYVSVDEKGERTTLAHERNATQAMFSGLVSWEAKTSIDGFNVSGEEATADTTGNVLLALSVGAFVNALDAIGLDADTSRYFHKRLDLHANETIRIQEYEKSQDTWVRIDGKWKRKKSHTQSHDMSINGHKMGGDGKGMKEFLDELDR